MSDLPTITHPTGRPNFTEVYLHGDTYWFSYRTCIAFQIGGSGRVVRENDWGPTTGKHLNLIDGGDKARRISGDDFEAILTRLAVPVVMG